MDNFDKQTQLLNEGLESLKKAAGELVGTLDGALEKVGKIKFEGVESDVYTLKDGSVMFTFKGKAPQKAAQKIINKLTKK